jgi:hypothetical protein
MDVLTRRITGLGVEPARIDGVCVGRVLNHPVAGQPLSKHLGTDHDPQLRLHRWLATLRVIEMAQIKPAPCTPVSRRLVERLIGMIRREVLDRMFSGTRWT